MNFKRISIDEAQQLLTEGAQLADIRDEQSYQLGHIEGASHLRNDNLQAFIEAADPDQALIIYCYHGNSSQSAAQFFVEKDFTEVYSMDGGFEAWRQHYPQVSGTE
ncbi:MULTISPECIES: thiosulfate sulfurtransferase GlpE [Spongiibacter]|uniref:thiosulfate sulfurtransferase GlpE n=1 Tax=Spongiibacter TaxID=630749 RepID=UPI0003B788E2|nr:MULTISPECIES: thiosulfate sulfurtransferase GlpE [Spongiibacter]MAY40054.1 thiosulfate sulfurtransferase GlpE [Spongiibacter sp.]MBI58810.1 thiosulfate sulfurtransferase GlpE [Spongiibacter sp.]MBO6751970.1 thiosulfate sulfurtransferase GlpE [Spongiibacter sp.]|tara:strand:- start:7944 stop:8261 length:318 start_codon:yes stop_codon:yes gene_type:complete